MNGDPKKWRVIGALLMVPYLVFLATEGASPFALLIPLPLFYLWRAWDRRPKKRKADLVVEDTDVIDVEFRVIERR